MTHYRERLSPSPFVFVAVILIIPATMIVFAPLIGGVLGPVIGAIVGIVIYAATLGFFIGGAPVIEVTPGLVRVGRAKIPAEFIESCEGYRGVEASYERGRYLDARAFLCIRGWVDPVVKMRIADPQDPTPYWLVSTRRPGDLIDAVTAAQKV
jgi:hypothetical protein